MRWTGVESEIRREGSDSNNKEIKGDFNIFLD